MQMITLSVAAMLLATTQAAPGFLQSTFFGSSKTNHPQTNGDICLKVCWPETPACPEGWNPKNYGSDYEPCWTCCKSIDDDAKHHKIAAAEHKSSHVTKVEDISIGISIGKNMLDAEQQICWLACFGEEPTCPAGWEAKDFGSGSDKCWTCCRKEEEEDAHKIEHPVHHAKEHHVAKSASKGDISVTVNVNEKLSAMADVCLMVCWYEEPSQCPEGWKSKNLGVEDEPCWTCCRSYNEDNDL